MKIYEDYNLSNITWFKTGGTAKCFIKPANVEELKAVYEKFSNFEVIGNTSNLLIADGTINIPIVKLGTGFAKIEELGSGYFKVGSACLDSTLSQTMQMHGISGMEFLYTIPGSVGGNVVMNAGCYGSEIIDVIHSIELFVEGRVEFLYKNEIKHYYRYIHLPKGAVVLGITVKGSVSTSEKVANTMKDLMEKRVASQPQNVRTGGSTFKNPEGTSAWKLIRDCNAHLLKIGGAEVSEKHSNFLINAGGATSQDIFNLGEAVRKKVFEHSGIMLEWEIKRLGF